MYQTVGELITKAKVEKCGDRELPILSMTMHDGIMFQGDRFKKQIASVDQSTYNVVYRNQLVVSFPIDEGVLAVQDITDAGIVSPAYKIWNVDEKKVVPKYLEAYLRSPHSIQYYKSKLRGTTARRRSITDSDLLEMDIPLPSIEKQRCIIENIRRVKSLQDAYNCKMELLDKLIKARFVEMFGEPGTDTKGWGLQPISMCCELNPKKASDYRLKEGLDVSFIPMPAVSENGAIDVSEIRKYDEVKSGFTYFADNDVLFAKITPCMENGKGAVAVGLRNGVGFGSTEFHVLRPIAGKSNPYWLYTLTAFETFRKSAEMNMTGSAGQRRIPAGFFEKYMATVPPIELQKRFEEYVKQIDKSRFVVQKAWMRHNCYMLV